MKQNFYLDLCVVLGVAALQLVRRHDKQSLSLNELFNSIQIRLFQNIDIQTMNDSLLNTLKYLCNYGTYRFGLELSLFASLCLIILRMDAIALIHAIILLICILLPRQYVRRFWKLYRIFSSISAVWLYLNALGECLYVFFYDRMTQKSRYREKRFNIFVMTRANQMIFWETKN